MSEAAPTEAAQCMGQGSGPKAGGSAPEVRGLGFAALNDEAGNTHM